MTISIPTILRLASFLSIVLGLTEILALTTRAQFPKGVFSLASPDEALGLIFMGFALRNSRLEDHSGIVRVIVKTSRASLLIIGFSGMAGLHLVPWGSTAFQSEARPTFAAGIGFALISGILIIKRSPVLKKILPYLSYACCSFLGACWVAIVLSLTGLISAPAILAIGWLPAALMTPIALILAVWINAPGLAHVLSGSGPDAATARRLFPLAFIVPLLLAVLRQQAERSEYLHPHAGLLLHVLLSVACMAALVAWNANRMTVAHQIERSVERVYRDGEAQLRELLSYVTQPVWILGPDGGMQYRNSAAAEYFCFPNEQDRLSANKFPLGQRQHEVLVRAALFGRGVAPIRVRHLVSGTDRDLQATLVKTMKGHALSEVKVLVLAEDPGADAEVSTSLRALSAGLDESRGATAELATDSTRSGINQRGEM
ncbi:MAG: hypothetical protein HYX27_14055 [Acidobacteria bacterium]|nr:hypothetical protein [Acidobacteriota bacterium]